MALSINVCETFVGIKAFLHRSVSLWDFCAGRVYNAHIGIMFPDVGVPLIKHICQSKSTQDCNAKVKIIEEKLDLL